MHPKQFTSSHLAVSEVNKTLLQSTVRDVLLLRHACSDCHDEDKDVDLKIVNDNKIMKDRYEVILLLASFSVIFHMLI